MAARLVLGGLRREIVRAAFCEFFGIGSDRADLLIALFEFYGKPASYSTLGHQVNSHRRPSRDAMQEAIRFLREAMSPEAIDRSERGYFLTEVGLADCRDALQHMGETLALVGASYGIAA